MAKKKDDAEREKTPLSKRNFGYQKGELPEKIWTYLVFLLFAIILYWLLGIIGIVIDIIVFFLMERYLDKKYALKPSKK